MAYLPSVTEDRIRNEWARGAMPLLVLGVLAQEPGHGYAVGQRLEAMGFGVFKGSALYPVLNRLESEGSLEAQWVAGEGGPGRKSYAVTEGGRGRLMGLAPTWQDFARQVDDVLGSAGRGRPSQTQQEGS